MKTIFQIRKKLAERWRTADGYSRLSVKLGALMMLSFYISGTVAYLIAPHVPNYFGAMSVFRGSMEAAPASLASGFCVAVVCELVRRSQSKEQ